MKDSVLRSKLQRSFDRSTEEYKRETVRKEGRLIYDAAALLKAGKLDTALNLLLSTTNSTKRIVRSSQAIPSITRRSACT